MQKVLLVQVSNCRLAMGTDILLKSIYFYRCDSQFFKHFLSRYLILFYKHSLLIQHQYVHAQPV